MDHQPPQPQLGLFTIMSSQAAPTPSDQPQPLLFSSAPPPPSSSNISSTTASSSSSTNSSLLRPTASSSATAWESMITAANSSAFSFPQSHERKASTKWQHVFPPVIYPQHHLPVPLAHNHPASSESLLFSTDSLTFSTAPSSTAAPVAPAAQTVTTPASMKKTPGKKRKNAAAAEDEPPITSKYRGVCWYKRTKRWVAQTKVNGKRVHLGYFDDEESAAQAYRDKLATLDRGNKANGGEDSSSPLPGMAAGGAAVTNADLEESKTE